MSTPISSSISYVTPGEMQNWVDVRQLYDCINDDGTRATQAQFLTSPVTYQHLMGASGMLEMACLKGERYTVADLQSVTGVSRTALSKIVSELAWWSIRYRRHPELPMPIGTQWAFQQLEELGKGLLIFGQAAQAAAGVELSGEVTRSDARAQNSIPLLSERYFGRRARTYNPTWPG